MNLTTFKDNHLNVALRQETIVTIVEAQPAQAGRARYLNLYLEHPRQGDIRFPNWLDRQIVKFSEFTLEIRWNNCTETYLIMTKDSKTTVLRLSAK